MSKKPGRDSWQPSATGSEGNCHTFEISPDARIRFDIDGTEVRNGEWFQSLIVTDLETGKQLLALPHPWDVEAKWTGPHDFSLVARRAHGRGIVRADIDVDAGTITIERTGDKFPLAQAEHAIERDYSASVAGLSLELPEVSMSPTSTGQVTVDWKKIFLIGVLAIAALAAALLGGFLLFSGQPEEPSLAQPAPSMKQVEY